MQRKREFCEEGFAKRIFTKTCLAGRQGIRGEEERGVLLL